MRSEVMARMANQVADFFRAYPRAEACAGIRDHLMAFWTPGMRSAFQAYVASGRTELDPLVLEAVRGWPEAASPVARATAPAAASGQGASDAG